MPVKSYLSTTSKPLNKGVKVNDVKFRWMSSITSRLYRRVHRSRGIGLWLVLLDIHAVIGGCFNMR